MPTWRVLQLLSTAALLAGIVLLVADVPAGWWLLIASGLLFGAELLLRRRA